MNSVSLVTLYNVREMTYFLRSSFSKILKDEKVQDFISGKHKCLRNFLKVTKLISTYE